MRILVTGGAGGLGRQLTPRLVAAGHEVRVMSRRTNPVVPGGVEVCRGDLASGTGLGQATAGMETVVHCATNPAWRTRRTDVDGTARLLDAARDAGVTHLFFISIVGVDGHPWPYYKDKYRAEQLITASGMPWTILRATQFHDLLFMGMQAARRLPFMPVVRGVSFQPIDSSEVAEHMTAAIADGPGGRLSDIGGPQVRPLEELARVYLKVRGLRKPLLRIPVPGRIGIAFRRGDHTCPDRAVGLITWEDYLARALA